VKDFLELGADKQHSVWQRVADVRQRLERELARPASTLGWTRGGGGQTVPHAHVHVILRYDDVLPPKPYRRLRPAMTACAPNPIFALSPKWRLDLLSPSRRS
jgi:diadenosine tetraphosphate (Ap4A) HIT family hydrolase